MASVKKTHGSATWTMCYVMPTGNFLPDGKPEFTRVQRSSGLNDESRAKSLAETYERAAIAAAEKQWTEKSARRFLAEIRAITGVSATLVTPCVELIQKWMSSQESQVSGKTFLNYQGVIADFLEFLGTERQSQPIDSLTGMTLVDFRDSEVKAGKHPNTVNKALSILAQIFDFAIRMQALESNPARGINLRGADKKKQTRRAFTFEQFRALIAATAPEKSQDRVYPIHPDWQSAILCAGYTGGRQQEIARLDWADVDFEQQTIGLRKTKPRPHLHLVPLHESLASHLRTRHKAAGSPKCGPVLPHFAIIPGRKISRYFRETILPLIGIVQPYRPKADPTNRGRKTGEFVFHSLKHSFSTWLNAAGVQPMLRRRIVGHDDEEVNDNYTHTDLQDATREVAKLPRV